MMFGPCLLNCISTPAGHIVEPRGGVYTPRDCFEVLWGGSRPPRECFEVLEGGSRPPKDSFEVLGGWYVGVTCQPPPAGSNPRNSLQGRSQEPSDTCLYLFYFRFSSKNKKKLRIVQRNNEKKHNVVIKVIVYYFIYYVMILSLVSFCDVRSYFIFSMIISKQNK
jgi:hypothetical protein